MNGDQEGAKAAVLKQYLWVDLVGPEFKRIGEQQRPAPPPYAY
jgi:hypothetical protein